MYGACDPILTLLIHLTIVWFYFSLVPTRYNSTPQETDPFTRACPRRRLAPRLQSNTLIKLEENYLSDAQIAQLQKISQEENQVLPKKYFDAHLKNTYVIFTFTAKGWIAMQRHASLAPIAIVIQRLYQLQPDANVWKVAVNSLRPRQRHDGKEVEGELEIGVEGVYLDQLIATDGNSTCRIGALQVSVL
ncbi:g1108 [Coccomyxa elongata]